MQFLKIAGFPPDQLQSSVILFYSISGMQHRAGTTLAIHFLLTLKRDRVSEKARIVPIMQHPFSLWGFSPPGSYSHTGLQNVCSGSTVFSSWCNRQNWWWWDFFCQFSSVNTEDYFTDDESIAQWVHWFCDKRERKRIALNEWTVRKTVTPPSCTQIGKSFQSMILSEIPHWHSSICCMVNGYLGNECALWDQS